MLLKNLHLSAGDSGGAGEQPPADNSSAETGGEPKGNEGGTAGTEKDETNPEPEETYTKADIEKLKAEHETAIKKAVEEAEKKAKMKPDEKEEYEKDQKLIKLEKMEKELTEKQLRLDALEELSKRSIDKEFLDYVLADNLENTLKRIETFKKVFDAKLHEKHVASFAGNTPPANTGGGQTSERDKILKALGGR